MSFKFDFILEIIRNVNKGYKKLWKFEFILAVKSC